MQKDIQATEFSGPTINNMFAWFKHNIIVANSGKSNFLVNPCEKTSLKILGSTVKSSPCEELLGITIDSELTFHKHRVTLCSNVSALARTAKYLTIDKGKILLNSVITAQFNPFMHDVVKWPNIL